MFKQGVLLIIATALVIILREPLTQLLHFFLLAHHHLTNGLNSMFSGDEIGRLVQNTLSLALIPFLIGLLAAIPLYIIKKSHLHYAQTIIWIVWIILSVLLLAQAGSFPSSKKSGSLNSSLFSERHQ